MLLNEIGFIFRGDTHALAREILALNSDRDALIALKMRAFEEASKRSWSKTLKEISETLKRV